MTCKTTIPLRVLRHMVDADRDEVTDHWRPTCRAECPDERPCPYVGCRHNLYLDVKPNGAIVVWRPWLSPENVPPDESCALDIAESGDEPTEADIARMFGWTRQNVNIIVLRGVARLAAALVD